MGESDPTVESELEQLSRRWVAGSLDHVEALEAAVDRLADAGSDLASLAGLREGFHRLSGSGTTFGYPRVSTLAAAGEGLVLMAEMAGSRGANPGLVSVWRQLVSQLRRELGAAAEEVRPGGAAG